MNTTDPDESIIWYSIDWGDNTNTGWIGPYDSDKEITLSHTWSQKGKYTIRCKAKDPYDAESEWSEFKVIIPRTRISSILWYQCLLERFPLLDRLLYILF